jgi:hypothetical protein
MNSGWRYQYIVKDCAVRSRRFITVASCLANGTSATQTTRGISLRINISALRDHISSANLARHNMGIISAGARFGFRF